MTKKTYSWIVRVSLGLWLLGVVMAANGWLVIGLGLGLANIGLDLYGVLRVRCRRYNRPVAAILYLCDIAVFFGTFYAIYQGRFLYMLWLVALINLIERVLYTPVMRLQPETARV